MLRTTLFVLCVALGVPGAAAQQPSEPVPAAPDAVAAEAASEAEEAAALAAAREEFEKSITRRTGKVDIADGQVTLSVPDGFYYLDQADSNRVLVDAWGNPPGHSTEGMLFPAGASPLDEGGWGVVIEFDDSGYVSDQDAASIDYDQLLKDMQSGEAQENAERSKSGYPPIHLVGWATPPRYDGATHKLYWASELKFAEDPEHTLNYNMRVLGRKGVLVLNFVAGLEDLKEVEQASPAVLSIPEFNAGSRYEDFNAATDKKSDFGVAGLIAGGAAGGLLLAKKTGLIGIALVFLKKAWVLVVLAFGAIGTALRSLFGGKARAQAKTEQKTSTAFFDNPPDARPPAGSPPTS
jgi:uncharacterized membrane-anchored protein